MILKNSIAAFILMVILVFAAGPISKIRYEDASGGVYVGIKNSQDKKLEDVKVRVFIPSLGVFVSGGEMDIDKRGSVKRWIYLDAKEVPKGEYLVRITASSNREKDIRYRYITVI